MYCLKPFLPNTKDLRKPAHGTDQLYRFPYQFSVVSDQTGPLRLKVFRIFHDVVFMHTVISSSCQCRFQLTVPAND
jgi:hypothetical protein